MQLALVVGHAHSTVKHASLKGWKLSLIQLVGVDDKPDGEPVLAIDSLGVAVGDRILACNDGAEARKMTGDKTSPARWFVMGMCDE